VYTVAMHKVCNHSVIDPTAQIFPAISSSIVAKHETVKQSLQILTFLGK